MKIMLNNNTKAVICSTFLRFISFSMLGLDKLIPAEFSEKICNRL